MVGTRNREREKETALRAYLILKRKHRLRRTSANCDSQQRVGVRTVHRYSGRVLGRDSGS